MLKTSAEARMYFYAMLIFLVNNEVLKEMVKSVVHIVAVLIDIDGISHCPSYSDCKFHYHVFLVMPVLGCFVKCGRNVLYTLLLYFL